MPELSYISQITLPSGNTYYLKDTEARQMITGGVHYRGRTTTALTDQSETNPITIDGESYTAQTGDLVIYKASTGPDREFIWSGTKWDEFGVGIGTLGSLAYKNSASGTYKKATGGSVTVPKTYTFTGTAGSVSVTSGTFTRVTAVTPTTKYVKAVASGAALSTTNETVLTGVKVTAQPTVTLTGSADTSTGAVGYVSAVSATATNKLVTTLVGSASAGTAKDVAKAGTAVVYGKANVGTAVTVATGLSGDTTFAKAGVTVTVSDEVLTFATAGTGTVSASTTSVTPATAAPNSQTIIPAVANGQITPVTVSSVTVATGSVASTGSGSAVVTAVTPTTKYLTAAASGTAVGANGTASVIKTASVGTQPSVALSLEDSTATGRVGVVTAVGSTSETDGITSTGSFTPAGGVATATTESKAVTVTNEDATVTVS